MTEGRPKLTKREIDALTCPPDKRDVIVFDGELRGFGVRVTIGGEKVFLFQYRRGTVLRRLRLGRYGDLTPAQARKLAEAARGEVAAGRDPAGERRQAMAAEATAAADRKRQAVADALTLDALISSWAAVQLHDRSAPYRREAQRGLRKNLPELLTLPAHAITPAMIRAALDRMIKPKAARVGRKAKAAKNAGKEAPPLPAKSRAAKSAEPPAERAGEVMARRTRTYGHAMFGWAVQRELVPSNPFASVVVEGKDKARERFLTVAEVGEVWRAAGLLGWPWGPYFRFLLLTLQRGGETAGLEWSELAPKFEAWELPGGRTKNGRAHTVHLAEPARAILLAVPRMKDSRLVFTTTGKTAISGFSKAKAALDEKIMEERAKAAAEAGAEPAELVPWRPHDFRRTGVTHLAELGVRQEVADRLLNHRTGVIQGVAAIYQRYEFMAERKAAMELWAAHVLAAGEGKAGTGANVVKLRPRARGRKGETTARVATE
jgi:integrase